MSNTIQIGHSVYAVVPARAVLEPPHDRATARRWAEQMLADNAAQLREYLEHQMLVPLNGDPAETINVIADLLQRGSLTLIRDLQEARPLDASQVRDLIDPAAGPSSSPRPREPREPTAAETWVSFEVVGSDGTPAEGEFRCIVDSRTESGRLEDGEQRYDPVAGGSAAQLYIDILRWPPEARGVDEPAVTPKGPAVDPDEPKVTPASGPVGDLSPTAVSFEVVGEDGKPWSGTAEVGFGGAVETVELGGRFEAEVGAGAVGVRLVLVGRARAS